ncbi:MAG TPA: chemotaxis protein CheW [Polyangia bacterium]|nr:chemotaxis protein CheW [Polyangia bacterium]
MSFDEAPGTTRAAALRRAFDGAFAAPPVVEGDETIPLLALRVGGQAYAVKLGDITGLLADRRIVAVPSTAAEFLGIAGLRGSTVPVWSLTALLGYGASRETPRWLISFGDGAARQALALAFEHFEGHLNVPRAALSDGVAASPDGPARSHVRQSVRVGDAQRAVLDLSSIVEAIRRKLGHDNRHETKDR